ncbi:MAG: hypothetical protein MK209_01095 [Planctomycetes bacterium]|nr:hypothetical protein [Planctomycetota bacterium]
MSQSNRGAAQVSMMWAIAFLVIALVSIFVSYSTSGKLKEAQDELVTSQQEVVRLDQAEKDRRDEGLKVSQKAGWQPERTALSNTDLMTNSIQQIGSIFPNVDPNAETVEAVLPTVISDYSASQSRIADMERQIAQLRADLDARQAETDTAISDKDQRIDDLEGELDDTRNSMNEQIVDLERQRDALRDQYRELDDRLTQTEAEKDAEIATVRTASATMKQRNDILSSQLNQVSRRADSADGAILTSNARVNKAWIDLGRTSRVAPGLQFEVLDQTSGAAKGRVEVISVEDGRSEVAILATADKYNPIATGDKIRNAVFDPSRQPVAVLLGNGFGAYSADDMKIKLAEVGISVVDDVTVETDYLLLGTPFFDEETGDMMSWEQQDSYRAARGLSVEVVPRRDWLSWLGL